MTVKKNNVVSKKFKGLVQFAIKAYEQINAQENKIGENMFNLGKTLVELKVQNKEHKYYTSFEELCKECFAFSRQYGYRMIKFYKIQKDLHKKGLLEEGTYQSSSMLLSLMRAKKPSDVWEEASRESKGKPTEKLVSQIIDRDKQATGENEASLQDDIAQATADKIISVLLKIKNKKYSPSSQEQLQLIALLKESWNKAKDEEQNSENFESEGIA